MAPSLQSHAARVTLGSVVKGTEHLQQRKLDQTRPGRMKPGPVSQRVNLSICPPPVLTLSIRTNWDTLPFVWVFPGAQCHRNHQDSKPGLEPDRERINLLVLLASYRSVTMEAQAAFLDRHTGSVSTGLRGGSCSFFIGRLHLDEGTTMCLSGCLATCSIPAGEANKNTDSTCKGRSGF